MKNNLFKGMIIFSLFLLCDCKKDSFNESIFNKNETQNKKSLSISNINAFVSYNNQYQMLEFVDADSFNALADLYYNTNVELDRGNNQIIKELLEQAFTFGFTNSNNPNQSTLGPINLPEFKILLSDSYPLSDEILNEIIELNDIMSPGFPNNFLSSVFEKNLPLSENVRNNLENSNFPNFVKTVIINEDNNKFLVPDYNAKSIHAQLGFSNSLLDFYRGLKEQALKNGIDPESSEFPKEEIADEFLLLVLNEKKEVKIGSSFYLYTPCGLVEITNGDFSVVQFIRNNGGIPVAPRESKIEPTNGYPIQQIESLAPDALIIHDNLDFGNGTLDVTSNVCSKAFFAATFQAQTQNGGIKMDFHNASIGSNLTFAWDFGDGYGSYAQNPTHIYSNPGYYNVKLTVWGEKCCKSTFTYQVRAVDATCLADFWATPGSYPNSLMVSFTDYSTFSQNITTPTYSWDFGDGTQTSSQQHPSHTYSSSGTYSVCLTITVDNCTDTKCKQVTITNPNPPDCCDLNDRNKQNFHSYDNNNRKIEYKIFMTNFGLIYHAMGSKTENYKKKNNGNWKHEKADVIHASWAGTPYHKGTGDCNSLQYVNPGSTENNKKTTSMVWNNWGLPTNNRLGAKQHSIQSQHFVKFNGQYIYTPTLYLTEDCD
jgi:PKD repeat protein